MESAPPALAGKAGLSQKALAGLGLQAGVPGHQSCLQGGASEDKELALHSDFCGTCCFGLGTEWGGRGPPCLPHPPQSLTSRILGLTRAAGQVGFNQLPLTNGAAEEVASLAGCPSICARPGLAAAIGCRREELEDACPLPDRTCCCTLGGLGYPAKDATLLPRVNLVTVHLISHGQTPEAGIRLKGKRLPSRLLAALLPAMGFIKLNWNPNPRPELLSARESLR
ncbi:hypothetical protein E2320_007249 [Naja naja]|nr:hypothetical protein E2320_007249 [Naja naja]